MFIVGRIRKRLAGNMLMEYPQLGLVVVGVFVVFLGLTSIWPVFTIYMQGQGISLTDISLITGASMAANFLFQVPAGWVSDRIGRKPLLVCGLLLRTITSLLYLGVHDPWLFGLLRFIDGIAAAADMPAARAFIMDTIPSERRGQAFGLLGAAFNGGMMLGPAIGGFLAAGTGMVGPFWFGAISSGVAGIWLAWQMIGGKPPHHAPPPVDAPAGAPAAVRLSWRAIAPLFASTIGWGFVVGFFSVVWNIWIHDLGGDLNVIGFSYTLFALPMVLVGPWGGRLADRYNRVWLILIPSLVAGLVYFSYGFITSIPVILVLGVVEGTMIALITPASDSYMADVLPPAMRGRLQGMISTTNTAVGFAGTLLCGPLYVLGPPILFTLMAALNAGSASIAAALMWPQERRLRAHKHAAQAAKDALRPVLEAEAA
jgi:MFS family permease